MTLAVMAALDNGFVGDDFMILHRLRRGGRSEVLGSYGASSSSTNVPCLSPAVEWASPAKFPAVS